LATIRKDIDAVDELQQLKALVAEQQLRLEALETHKDSPNGGDTSEKRSTRRQMLKLAGATLVGAAGSAALRAMPAAAADGDPMTVGIVRTETFGYATGVNASSAYFSYAGYFAAGYAGTGVAGVANSYFGTGVRGTANPLFGVGVSGYGSAIGVYGTGPTGLYGSGVATGVFGFASTAATTGIGVWGNGPTGVAAYTSMTSSRALYAYTAATSSVAVQAKSVGTGLGQLLTPAVSAYSKNGIGTVSYGYLAGVWASNVGFGAALRAANFGKGGGPDLKLSGTGRLVQVPTVTGGVGAPNYTPFSFGYGELVRAYDGALWINRNPATTGATLKAAWKRVNAVRVDAADGSGSPFTPFRLVDTRPGAKPAKNSTIKYTVAGAGFGLSSIPSDAVAVIGNLTAIGYVGPGFLAISPAGVTVATSSVNFIPGAGAIGNSFIVGLGTGATNGGKLQVHVSNNSACDYTIDITGYLQ